MSQHNDLRPLLGVLLVASLVLLVANSVLCAKAYERKRGNRFALDRLEEIAAACGLVGAVIWTIVLWPVMTGSASGTYIVRVNGVVTGGGGVSVFYGFVPLFIAGVALIGAPQAIGYGIYVLRAGAKAGAGRTGNETSAAYLAFSIIAVVMGLVFGITGIVAYAMGGTEVPLWRGALVVGIGALAVVSGVRGILRYASAKRRR